MDKYRLVNQKNNAKEPPDVAAASTKANLGKPYSTHSSQ